MTNTVLSLAFGATSLLLIALSVPLIRRRVGPNRFYGFRTPTTLKDERLWYEVNAKAGLDLLAVGSVLALVTIAHIIGAIPPSVFLVTATVLLAAGALWSTIHGLSIIARSRH